MCEDNNFQHLPPLTDGIKSKSLKTFEHRNQKYVSQNYASRNTFLTPKKKRSAKIQMKKEHPQMVKVP